MNNISYYMFHQKSIGNHMEKYEQNSSLNLTTSEQ